MPSKKMNREDIIRMAREAGLVEWLPNTNFSDGIWWIDAHEVGSELERFAALVASAEREACAKLLEQAAEAAKNADPQGFVWQAVEASAEVIRARGQA
jgi:hypothetical protein